MKSETGYDTFTRTRSTWLTLTGAGLLWVGACVWAFSAVEFGAIANTPNSAPQAVQVQAQLALLDALEGVKLDGQAAAAEQREQTTEAEIARLALEAEEQARFEAQGNAAERRRIAAVEEAEMAALKAKALAGRKAKRAAASEALAKQEARTRAAEEAKLAAEARAAKEARLAEAAKVAEQERVTQAADARQRAALTRQSTGVDEAARKAAAAEASRIASLARQQRSYASARGRELGVLSELSSRLRFAPDSATVSRQTERILDDIFNPLYLYSEASILVSVATNEYDGTRNDGLLSRDRGRAIASYLINRGLEKERFRIHIESGEELSAGTHRVRVSAEEVRK